MKSAGSNPDLWYVSINGKTGFVNNRFLRENKIIEKNLEVVPFVPEKDENVKPDKVQHPHEVFEGTTIYTTEAAVSDAQQDSSTESPTTLSNEDLTPSLNSAVETPDQNGEKEVPNQYDNKVKVDNENLSGENVNSEALNNEEPSTTTTAPEIAEQAEASATTVSDVNESVESLSEKVAETTEEASNNSEQNEPSEAKQGNEELPKDTPTEPIPAQILLPTVSQGSLNSESVLEVPEKQDYLQNTLTESEQPESKEQNTSSLNNLENVQAPEETVEPNNVPNGNSLNDVVDPGKDVTEIPTNEPEVIPVTEPTFTTTTEAIVNPNSEPVVIPVDKPAEPPVNEPVVPSVNEPVVPPVNEPVVEPIAPPVNEPLINQINQVIPPIYTNLNAENQYNSLPLIKSLEPNENTAPTEEHMVSASQEIPQTIEPVPAPTADTFPPVASESELPTTQTLPPIFSHEPQTVQAPETIPPLVSMEAPPTTEYPPQELPPYTYSNTAAPNNPDESYKNEEISEPAQIEDTPSYPEEPVEDIISALPDTPEDISSATTEAPAQSENSDGFFSNMYSTVADIWPSSTESPEPLYNAENPTYDSEKADGNEGFSFMKYFMSTYYSIMGTSEETKALFASVGKFIGTFLQ